MLVPRLNSRINRLLKEVPEQKQALYQQSVVLRHAVRAKISSPSALLLAAFVGFMVAVRGSCTNTEGSQHHVRIIDRIRRLGVVIWVLGFQRIKRSISAFTTA